MKTAAHLLCLALLSSCLLKPKLTGKVWNLVDVTSPSGPHFDTTYLGSFIRFYDNGTYTGKLDRRFGAGRWALNGNILTLHRWENDAQVYKVTSLGPGELVIHPDDPRTAVDFRFEPGPAREDSLTDPFSLVNNKWEIPALHPEPDSAILARVRGHLRCELLYIELAIDSKAESVSTTEFISPLGFYGNGITLKPEARVPDGWTRLFYDSAGAHRGYEALRNAFRANIAVPNTQNTFLLYKGILSQLYDNVHLDTSAIIINAVAPR
ncbi:MAG TPA: lipocalin family protein [Dinghuibacter sp.]|uniref:lipocalin family protein n=1 Tax=Dinghuibacter sp. TaxID=2024697 RepID=UPI002CC87D3D|nr:lipocalin family protein [Dinghuibacter sp.]HTJ13248.1 lipocalin family protein [Dinghuibacter sp.]